jgi:hypothetical protein
MPNMTEGKKNKKQVNGAQILMKFLKELKNNKKRNIKVVIEQVQLCQVKVLLVCLILVNLLEF